MEVFVINNVMRKELRKMLDQFYAYHKDREFEEETYEDFLRKAKFRYFSDIYDILKNKEKDIYLYQALVAMEDFKKVL